MACKNCKGNNLNNYYGTKLEDLKDATEIQKRKWLEKNWDDSMGKLNALEKGVVILFAWIPLLIGYFYVVKFFISLF